jgi:hypothetical protein
MDTVPIYSENPMERINTLRGQKNVNTMVYVLTSVL